MTIIIPLPAAASRRPSWKEPWTHTRGRRLAFAGLIAVLIAGAAIVYVNSRETYRIPVEKGPGLTEPIALGASRRALQMAGHDPRALEPVCYRPDCSGDTRYLARATPEAGTGYTLWRISGRSDALFHLHVRLRQGDGYIDCDVSTAK
jgi:hypothetical protein